MAHPDHRRGGGAVALVAGLALLGRLAAADGPALSPGYQRLDLEPQAAVILGLTLRAPAGTVVTAILADCACLRAQTTPPLTVPASGTVEIPMRVSGVRPGVEDVAVATTAGTARARIQIAGPGAGTGLPVLAATLQEARTKGLAVWGVVHDLNGQVRNCGCSQGSLGGAGHLAALPAQAAALAPGVALRWVLTGAVDGKRPGLGAALAGHGWSLDDPAVRVAADVGPLLAEVGVVAVIPLRPVGLGHQRILHPALPLGMSVDLLLVDAQGRIQARRVLPVDGTLADDPSLAARFPDRLTQVLAEQVHPAKSCASCHQAEFAVWARSRHAQAFARLPPADRTDACVRCHTAPLLDGRLAPNVHCQDCHQGGDAHAMAPDPRLRRTTGLADCRSCHDAQHHPAFRRERGWPLIRHGKGQAPAPGP